MGRGEWKMRIATMSVVIFMILALQQPAMAQNPSSAQEQEVDNTQEVTVGSQALVVGQPRSFPVPGNSPMPLNLPVPSHFTPPVMDGNFGSLANLLVYKSTYTEQDARSLQESHGKIRVITTSFLPENSRKPSSHLRILPDVQDKTAFNRRYRQIGIGNYKALDSDTISEQVLGIAVMEGLKIGADAMVFQEGAALIQVSSGYSAGNSNTLAFVNEATGNGFGSVGVGGLGFGKGQSGYSSNPWLRVFFFREIDPGSGAAQEKPTTLPEPLEEKSRFEQSLQQSKEPGLQEKYWGTR